MARILVIDDEVALHNGLRFGLDEHDLVFACNGREGLDRMDLTPDLALVLLDMKMPVTVGDDAMSEGLATLEAIRRRRPETPVIMMSSYSEIDHVVEAIKQGAFHYLTKPLDLGRLRQEVGRALEASQLRRENADLKEIIRQRDALIAPHAPALDDGDEGGDGNDGGSGATSGRLVGRSAAMARLKRLIARVAPTAAPALICGESGTGKELVAREIHDRSPRRDRPFVAVNASAIPRDLLESEMFGHQKGAFTGATADRAGCFEMADGGTLFLDEIGDMPMDLQPKLLRALQEKVIKRIGESQGRPVDFRVISATHCDLRQRIAEGRFREDLYFRLNVIPVWAPPLRERLDDLPLLWRYLMGKAGADIGLSDDGLQRLRAHPWPGNVRELENVVQRTACLADQDMVNGADLEPLLGPSGRMAPNLASIRDGVDDSDTPGAASAMSDERVEEERLSAERHERDAADPLVRLQTEGLRIGDGKAFADRYGRETLWQALDWAVCNSRDHQMAMGRLGYQGTSANFRQLYKRLRDRFASHDTRPQVET